MYTAAVSLVAIQTVISTCTLYGHRFGYALWRHLNGSLGPIGDVHVSTEEKHNNAT